MLKVYTLLGIILCSPMAMLAAVQESSYNPEAVRELVLGYDQFVKGNYTEAMEKIGLAVTYDESSVFLKVLYAEVLFRASRHADVIEVLEPIVARGDSIDTQVYKMLAVCYQATGDNKEAIRHYKQVLKQDPEEKWIRRRFTSLCSIRQILTIRWIYTSWGRFI
jgi:tetratricopeptide (TPR) repeat protein